MPQYNKFRQAVLISSLFFFVATCHAAESGTTDDEDYNFSWLDPDKKVYVLQNRKFRKTNRPALYVGGGMNLSNPFRTGYLGIGKAGFWLSEWLGLEGVGAVMSSSDNETLVAVRKRSTLLPFVREVRSYFGAQAAFAPFYAKINMFNYILYFDWFFNAGGGMVNTANDRNANSAAGNNFVYESHVGLFFGTALNFYLSKHFSVRLDLQGINYGASGADDSNRRFTSFDFTAGVGFLL